MRKFLVVFAAFIVLIISAFFITIKAAPKTFVWLFNQYSDHSIKVHSLGVDLWPIKMKAKGLTLTTPQGRKFVDIGQAYLGINWLGNLKGQHHFLNAQLSDGYIRLDDLGSEPANNNDTAKDSQSQRALDPHRFISMSTLQVNDITLIIDEQTNIAISRINNRVQNQPSSDYRSIESDFDIQLVYSTDSQSITANGTLQSRSVGDWSELSLNLPNLDLRSFIAKNDHATPASKASETDLLKEPVDTANHTTSTDTPEAIIDWAWLSSIGPTRVIANIDHLALGNPSLSNVALSLSINKSIDYLHTAQLSWKSEALNFNDTIELSGHWTPKDIATKFADLTGKSTLITPSAQIAISGDLNVNGVEGNQLVISANSKTTPFTIKHSDFTAAHYFPLQLDFNYQHFKEKVALSIDRALVGNSDVAGEISLTPRLDGKYSINAALNSKKLSYQTASDAALPDTSQNVPEQPNATAEKVFNDERIDFAWMDDYTLDIKWSIQQLNVNNTELNDIQLPLKLNDDGLSIDGLQANLGDGRLLATMTLLKEENNVIKAKLKLDVENIQLEKLKLLPPEQLSEGNTNITLELDSTGNTAHQLASQLNGHLFARVGEGTIGNDSFEIIGSDLVLSLLNKLNPFAKSDPSTALKCAVAKFSIENGVVNIDKSLAFKTSKLTVVADGKIHLDKEKIALKITPKARHGIGVDVSSLVKFIALGGTLSSPKPVVTASGIVQSGVVAGAAVSTGGLSLLAENLASKVVSADVCNTAASAFSKP